MVVSVVIVTVVVVMVTLQLRIRFVMVVAVIKAVVRLLLLLHQQVEELVVAAALYGQRRGRRPHHGGPAATATILLLLVSSVVDAAVAPFPFLGRRSADRVRVGGVSVELLRSGRNDDVGRCPRRRGYEAAPHLLRQRLVDSTFRLAVMASAAAKVQPPSSEPS